MAFIADGRDRCNIEIVIELPDEGGLLCSLHIAPESCSIPVPAMASTSVPETTEIAAAQPIQTASCKEGGWERLVERLLRVVVAQHDDGERDVVQHSSVDGSDASDAAQRGEDEGGGLACCARTPGSTAVRISTGSRSSGSTSSIA